MGANFYVACHQCREKAFALRGFESTGEVLTKFFHRHYDCGQLDHKNVQVIWDYFENPDWIQSESDYKDITSEISTEWNRTEDILHEFHIRHT